MEELVHLIHTNDFHSHFENWPKIRRFITERQTIYKKANRDYLTIDLGDFMDRYHPLTDVSDGKANICLMNQVQYDYVTIGNNEGITNTHATLDHLYDELKATVLLANLVDKKTGNLPKWAIPYHIYTTNLGTRIGLIALTTPINFTYHAFNWHAINPIDCLKEWLPVVEKEADVIVVLSHLGLPEDKKMAELFSSIDVIIGSHTHHLLTEGLMWHGCLLAAAGRFGEYVGEITLYIKNHTLVKKEAKTFCVDELMEEAADQNEVAHYQMKGEKLLEEKVVGYLPMPLKKETQLMETLLEAMKLYANVDVAILNTGVILTDLPQGKITKKEMLACLPHPMNLIRVKLKGRDVKRLVYEIERLRNYLFHHKIIGMKFRGKYFGEMCYDGIDYNQKTKEVLWRNQTIEDNKNYELVTVDHLSFVPFFPTIEIAGDIRIVGPDFLRTILGDYIKRNFQDK